MIITPLGRILLGVAAGYLSAKLIDLLPPQWQLAGMSVVALVVLACLIRLAYLTRELRRIRRELDQLERDYPSLREQYIEAIKSKGGQSQ